ncbi:MAG: phosphatidylserine decarboxylase family protein [Nitrospirae bacterium]|nr:phosphatidylserine decarboxylase family protein [Nitrospirota bacterium]
MKRERSPIAVEGIPFVIIAGIISLIFCFAGLIIPAGIFSLVTLFIIWFFRNPERTTPQGERNVISPADGKIIEIKEDAETRILKKRMLKISIFMNLFNVHVNRIPCNGRVIDILYNPGKFVSANLDKASLENEQNAVVLETPSGEKVIFIQIAGLIARRIVCWLRAGQFVRRGERFGLIRFGSRVDVYLPAGTEVMVSLGDKVKAGETILAVLK